MNQSALFRRGVIAIFLWLGVVASSHALIGLIASAKLAGEGGKAFLGSSIKDLDKRLAARAAEFAKDMDGRLRNIADEEGTKFLAKFDTMIAGQRELAISQLTDLSKQFNSSLEQTGNKLIDVATESARQQIHVAAGTMEQGFIFGAKALVLVLAVFLFFLTASRAELLVKHQWRFVNARALARRLVLPLTAGFGVACLGFLALAWIQHQNLDKARMNACIAYADGALNYWVAWTEKASTLTGDSTESRAAHLVRRVAITPSFDVEEVAQIIEEAKSLQASMVNRFGFRSSDVDASVAIALHGKAQRRLDYFAAAVLAASSFKRQATSMVLCEATPRPLLVAPAISIIGTYATFPLSDTDVVRLTSVPDPNNEWKVLFNANVDEARSALGRQMAKEYGVSETLPTNEDLEIAYRAQLDSEQMKDERGKVVALVEIATLQRNVAEGYGRALFHHVQAMQAKGRDVLFALKQRDEAISAALAQWDALKRFVDSNADGDSISAARRSLALLPEYSYRLRALENLKGTVPLDEFQLDPKVPSSCRKADVLVPVATAAAELQGHFKRFLDPSFPLPIQAAAAAETLRLQRRVATLHLLERVLVFSALDRRWQPDMWPQNCIGDREVDSVLAEIRSNKPAKLYSDGYVPSTKRVELTYSFELAEFAPEPLWVCRDAISASGEKCGTSTNSWIQLSELLLDTYEVEPADSARRKDHWRWFMQPVMPRL